MGEVQRRHHAGEGPGRSCHRSTVRQRPAQVLARYPNFDPKANYFNGYAADAISKKRAARWADPAGGYIHAMHPAMWGGFTYRITGKDAKGDDYLRRRMAEQSAAAAASGSPVCREHLRGTRRTRRMVSQRKTHTLYFYPPPGLDLAKATVEAMRLRHLIEFRGDRGNPVTIGHA